MPARRSALNPAASARSAAGPHSALDTWQDVDAALVRLCTLDNDRTAAEAQMNSELAAVKLRYQDALESQAREDAEIRAQIEQFAREHQGEFAPEKTIRRLHGILSFRKTPPAVVPLSRKWTVPMILSAIHNLNLADEIIRPSEEQIDKPAILVKLAGGDITGEQLANCGLRISQREVFGLDLKYERAPKVPTPQA